MEKNYLMLIIDGWVNDIGGTLPNYFYREFKKADKEDLPSDEFILRLTRVLEKLKGKMYEPYIRDVELWNDRYCREFKKGNIDQTPIPEAYYITLPLWDITGKYSHHISINDVEYINQSIIGAYEKLQKEKDNTNDGNLKNPSKLTLLLKLYFEKGCRPLSEQQVRKFASDIKFNAVETLVAYWKKLKSKDYSHTENTNNIKEFLKSYEALMTTFKESNKSAFKEVETRYNTLKEACQDVHY